MDNKGYHENYRGQQRIQPPNKLRIEIAVNEDHLQDAIDAITDAARTGKIGDGKIFVLDLGHASVFAPVKPVKMRSDNRLH